jgi:hypothetical protein
MEPEHVKRDLTNVDVFAAVRSASCHFSAGGTESPIVYIIGAAICAAVLVVVSSVV